MSGMLGKWYENITYDETKTLINEKLQGIARDYVALGYYLRCIRDNGWYTDDGYKSVHEFAQAEFGMSKSTVNHCIKINIKFSDNGNSPVISEKFRDFSKSQLQEMLYLEEGKLEEVTSDMTVKEIRGLNDERLDVEPVPCCKDCENPCEYACSRAVRKNQKNEEVCDVAQEGELITPIQRGCITGANPNGTCSCCGNNGTVECCGQCADDCNVRCGWLPEDNIDINSDVDNVDVNPERTVTEQGKSIGESGEEVIDAEYREMEEKYETTTNMSDMEILKEELYKSQDLLADMQKYYTDKDIRVRKQKLIVGALAGMVCDLEQDSIPKPEQPKLPVFKNNDQRKEWLRNYQAWGLWYEDENIGCRYYKYDFDNGARLVAEVYHIPKNKYVEEHDSYFFHLMGGPKPPNGKHGETKWNRHEVYSRYPNSETELVEFLKYIQKGEE